MQYEKMDERVEMIAHFAPGKVQPLRFLWRGRPHKITSVRGRWTTVDGRHKQCHFAIQAEGVGSCEIMFDLESLGWAIQSIAVGS